MIAEYRNLVQWLAQGAPMEPSPPPDDQTLDRIERWERFFNGTSNKQRLVSRYLCEQYARDKPVLSGLFHLNRYR